jgi:hypothetical protein
MVSLQKSNVEYESGSFDENWQNTGHEFRWSISEVGLEPKTSTIWSKDTANYGVVLKNVLFCVSLLFVAYYFCGATAQARSRLPHCWRSQTTHISAHKHKAGLLWTSDQLVAEAATYTTYNKHKRRTSTLPATFVPAIPSVQRLHTYAWDCTVTGVGSILYSCNIFSILFAAIN